MEKLCTECGEEKPLSEFYENKRLKGGYFNQCKKCKATRGAALYKKKHPPKPKREVPKGFKYCKRCDSIKDYKEFNKNKSTKDGLQFFCRKCLRKPLKPLRSIPRYLCLASDYKKCYECEDIKHHSKFYTSKTSKDGYVGQCKLCASRRGAERHAKKHPPKPKREVPEGTKYCSSCSSCKPLTQFYLRNSTKDGLNSTCKECCCKSFKKYSLKHNRKYLCLSSEYKNCVKCNVIKPCSDFDEDKRLKDGHATTCSVCSSLHKLKKYRESHPLKPRPHREAPEEGYKYCSSCNSTKSYDQFHLNKTSKDGRGSDCKECKRRSYEKRRLECKPANVSRRFKYLCLTHDYKNCKRCGVIKPISEFINMKSRTCGSSTLCKCCIRITRRSPTSTYSSYKYNAKRRNYEFNLTLEDFIEFWQQPCYYCGRGINDVGIDRIDNSLGYSVENCVPCCKICNQSKRDHLLEDFLNMCRAVAALHPQ